MEQKNKYYVVSCEDYNIVARDKNEIKSCIDMLSDHIENYNVGEIILDIKIKQFTDKELDEMEEV